MNNTLKRWLGLDVVDIVIHLGVTFSLMGFIDMSNGPEELMPLIFATSLVVLGIRRRLAIRGKTVSMSGEYSAERIGDLEERLRDIDSLQDRVLELEERLDFAERLLARQPETQGKLQGQ
ncbi:MAG: hypothetical protein ABI679_11720 [Gemmatimonadota bacterium]